MLHVSTKMMKKLANLMTSSFVYCSRAECCLDAALCAVQGFFKRSLQKADKYHCFNDGQCSLRRADRTRCKACRFRRCLVVGMSLQGLSVCLSVCPSVRPSVRLFVRLYYCFVSVCLLSGDTAWSLTVWTEAQSRACRVVGIKTFLLSRNFEMYVLKVRVLVYFDACGGVNTAM